MAIQSFGDKITETFFLHGAIAKSARWRTVSKVAVRKLDMLSYATQLGDLRSPPSNRLEKLKGDLARFYSVRVNDQWRIVFRWTQSGPSDVRIADYH